MNALARRSTPVLAALLMATLLMATLLTTCAPSTSQPTAALVEIPHPDLGAMEETARRQLEDLRAEVENAGVDAEPVRRAAGLGALGRAYMAYTFPEAAEACFDHARQLEPDSRTWHYLLGVLRQQRGDLEAAVDSFERVETLSLSNPKHPTDPTVLATRIRLGRSLMALGLTQEAEAAFTRALEIDAIHAAALQGLGRTAAARGDHPIAINHFKRAITLLPDDSVVHHALGHSYRQLGQLDQARHHLERRAERPVAFADPLLDEVSQLASATATEVVIDMAADSQLSSDDLVGFALSKLGDVGRATADLEQMLDGFAGDHATRARLHHVIGALLMQRNQTADGIPHLRAALELEPELWPAAVRLGDALAESGNYQAALDHYNHVLENHALENHDLEAEPEDHEILLKRATALVDLQQFGEALPDLRHLVELYPDDGRARLRLATALQGLGKDALPHWQRALELNLPDRERAFAWFSLANSLGQRGRFEDALAAYRSAVELEPTSSGAWQNLASLLDHLGRRDEAAEAYAAYAKLAEHHAGLKSLAQR